MRVGISLALSALLAQAIFAEEVCLKTSLSGDKINAGDTCTINSTNPITVSNGTLTNDGTIITNSGSSITFNSGSSSAITTTGEMTDKGGWGVISVKGTTTIDASKSNNFAIEGQKIDIASGISLILKSTTATLGGDNKLTSITGNSTSVSSTTNWGVTLDTTATLNTKNLSLQDIRIKGDALVTLTNTNTTFNNAHIISNSTSGLTFNADTSSNFTLIGESNTISAGTKGLNITGNHTFSGSGILDFVGGTITVGESGKATLLARNPSATEEKTSTLGFQAENQIIFKQLETSDLTLQIIRGGDNATVSNVDSTFTNGTLQALDINHKDQTLVIENGSDNLQDAGNITINAGITTFKGSGVEIYGQDITLNNTNPTTLLLSTIDDGGEIVLGKANSSGNKDGEVTIKGGNGSGKKTLQLRSLTTTFGGNVTLQDLQVSTQAKNELEDEGMIFSLSKDSTLTLNGVTLTSGIDKNYQDLSFATLEGTSTLKIDTADSSIKASSLSFDNQTIDLSSTLKLYSYGNVVVGNEVGSGMGNFAFTDTIVKNDSSVQSLNLYGNEGVKVLASNLTLKNITLTAYQTDGSNKNKIDLSDTGSNIIIQEDATIDAKEFVYGNNQGVGMDIKIIGTSNKKLLLKSETSGEEFTLGGTLTIDNSSNGSAGNSQFQVELNGTKTEEQTLKLNINGGLTAIGNASGSTTTTLKAKSFAFGAGSVVSSINGTLSLSASSGNNIDLTKALTLLRGTSAAEATITKISGTLFVGDVVAEGKTKIENVAFSNSNIVVRGLGEKVDTLTIKGDAIIKEIQSINLTNAKLDIKNSTTNAELQLRVGGSIVSNGDSIIMAKSIKGNGGVGTYSVDVQSGTLTIQESSTGNGIGTLTLGTENKYGGRLILKNGVNGNNTLSKTLEIISYCNSGITAKDFGLSSNSINISSVGGELKLSATSGKDTLQINQGGIALNNGSLSYYYMNSNSETLGKMTLHNTSTSVAITSTGTSSIKSSELDLKGNTITSNGGVLTLQGLKTDSTLGEVTINNAGGLTITKSGNADELTSVKLSSTLTLTANAPYVSSSSPLGGGKFGVLQAESVNFTAMNTTSPLIHIQVKDSPLSGEELFTLQEGGQIVAWTTGGITKTPTTTQKQEAITLDDITIDNGGYKSLSLDAELIPDSKTATQVNAIKVNLSVTQTSASDLTESISDNTAKEQMQTILTQGDNKEIIDSILGSTTNPLKVGFAENIAQGNVVVVGNALNYIDDTFKSVAESIHLNDRVQTQIYLSQVALVEGRMARHNNPHQNTSELLSFIRSYHNTHYASSDEELPASEESETHHSGKGSLWVSYDGGLATGGSSNSTINGISAGYDHALDSGSLVGGFVSYAYGAFDGTFLHNTSHNVGFGLYSRMVFGNNEVDLTLSQNIGLVTSDINVGNTTMPSLLNGAMEYNLYRTNVMARYGYNIKVGEEESPYYLKPLFGLNMSYTYQEGSESNAVASITMNEASLFKLEVSAGMEMRKYINEGTYFFVMPLIERELYGNSCDMNVGFVDSANLSYTLDYQSQTSVALYAGGEGNLTENLALSGSVGVKVGIEKSEVLTNWSVGLKYKF